MFVRNALLALGALCLSAGIALSILWYNQLAMGPAQSPQQPRPAILVATHDIAAGTLLRPEDMAFKEVPPSEVHAGALVRGQVPSAEFVGALVRRPFAADEHLVAADLVKPSERQFLSAALKPGMRAVSIAVDSPQSSAGLILPGDQVDIILTQSFGDAVGDAARKTVAETVLRDVRVIAVDQTLSTTGKPPRGAAQSMLVPEASRVPKTVTFEVTERDAERLFVAAQLGRLQLSIRPLEIVRVAEGAKPRASLPVWASDVSPALNRLPRGQAAQPTSPVEAAVRRPPASAQTDAEERP
jgi:pilus assembly protein CpaB